MHALSDIFRARTDRAVTNLGAAPPGVDAARKEIVPLTGLRGVAAAWVFLYHAMGLTHDLDPGVTWPLRLVASAGYLGVDLFFVLSGFVIGYNYAHEHLHRSWRGYGQFLWKRLARIWPAHTAALLFFASGLAIYQVDSDLSLVGLLKSLTLTQAWSLPGQATWNPVAWSVSCEWAAYLTFPLIALATQRLPPLLAIIGIGCCYVGLYGAFIVGPWGEGPNSMGLQRVAANFTAGVLVFRIWSARRVPMNLAGWVAITGLILGSSFIDMVSERSLSVAKLPILSCALVYTLACATGPLARTFARLRYAGCISYSFYLVHWVGLSMVQSLLHANGVNDSRLWVYAGIGVGIVIAIAMADFLYRNIERPAQRWMMRLTRARPALSESAQRDLNRSDRQPHFG